MADLVGRELGHYAVTSRIGRGGMGEVFRARDRRLGRDVAVKVLPPEVAGDPDRLARFEREARLLGSLSHPNVATLYGLEEHGGQRFLVMELAEGETLAARLERGPLPVDEALEVARQIARGLEAAHGRGIVHRDLKPANVMVSAEGKVKVLDFGLARALGPEGSSPPSSPESLASSPTLPVEVTRTGTVLGTAPYMSPEQARGRPVDRRTDVWAFGCVLWEMLTGRRLFGGEDATATAAAILTEEPDWGALPADTPPAVRRVLRWCLAKDPERRLHDVADARIALEETGDAEPDASHTRSARRWRTPALAGAGSGLLAIGLAAGIGVVPWLTRSEPRPPTAVRIETVASLPENQGAKQIALSPDGRHLAYVVATGLGTRVVHQPLDRFEAVEVPGSEGALFPFFSPDSRWLGFSARGSLKKVALAGGQPVDLCQDCGGSAAWSPDGEEILFTRTSLMRVPAAGGEVAVVSGPASEQRRYSRPAFLPDGRAVLLEVCEGPGRGTCAIGVLDLGSDTLEILVSPGTDPAYAASGHLLFARADELFAVAFDAARRRCSGEPRPVLENVSEVGDHNALYALSRNGLLAWVEWSRPSWLAGGRQLVWVDRAGRATPLSDRRSGFGRPSVSPDGSRLAVRISEPPDRSQIEILDLKTATWTRLTTGGGWKADPVWSPDGRGVVFSIGGSTAPGSTTYTLHSMPSDFSSDEPIRLFEYPTHAFPASFSPSGDLVFSERSASEQSNLLRLPAGGGEVAQLVRTPFDEAEGTVSPDGRWLAYSSDRSAVREVYVEPYPDGGPRTQLSSGGGSGPRWAPAGDEIFYSDGVSLIAVPVRTDPGFAIAGGRRVLFATDPFWGADAGFYDVDRDGRRFVMVEKGAEDEHETRTRRRINLILDWFSELERLVPTG